MRRDNAHVLRFEPERPRHRALHRPDDLRAVVDCQVVTFPNRGRRVWFKRVMVVDRCLVCNVDLLACALKRGLKLTAKSVCAIPRNNPRAYLFIEIYLGLCFFIADFNQRCGVSSLFQGLSNYNTDVLSEKLDRWIL